MDLTKTVWMGNIYFYMEENDIRNLIKPLSTLLI